MTWPASNPRLSRSARALLALLAAGLAACSSLSPTVSTERTTSGPVLIATWPFGQKATDRALESMHNGGSALDAIEAGVGLIESLGCDGTVGLAGRPNAAGYVQLDSCIMSGPDHNAGSVAALEGIVHPISVARKVMEDTPHVMLVGEGAAWFAKEHGFEAVDTSDAAQKKAHYQEHGPPEPKDGDKGHDTIGLLILDADGDLYGGTSTSGAADKLPGRVGDSPILGSGLYVENGVGAAAGTGLGENIMRYAASALIVEMMRGGMHPSQACEEMIHRMAQTDPRGYDLSVCFIALDEEGRVGAACSNGEFPFAVTTGATSEVRKVQAVQPR